MSGWPDRRVLDLFSIDVPIVQAPMAGAGTSQLAIAVSEAGGLGSLPCGQMTVAQAREAMDTTCRGTSRSMNVNFFCHAAPVWDDERAAAWRARLAPYYAEHGLDPAVQLPSASRNSFDADYCTIVEDYKPQVVSFHFGLPDRSLLERVKAAGAKVISSATTVAEARWLAQRGCDAIIAQGLEAGGHRGNFLTEDMATQIGTFALVPQIADAVDVPVIAAGGVADARGIVAAFALGAAAVQIGTAYLYCPEAHISALHLQALRNAADDATLITNVFTGRPARGIANRMVREVGPISPYAPAYPLAGAALAALRTSAERAASSDFTNLWSGQAARLAREMPAGDLTRLLAREALAKLRAVPP
ncbi:MAG TPA: nitronate monooxygenase family protein [Steroidobacteraceae bacterium]